MVSTNWRVVRMERHAQRAGRSIISSNVLAYVGDTAEKAGPDLMNQPDPAFVLFYVISEGTHSCIYTRLAARNVERKRGGLDLQHLNAHA